jgi:hypothetical protein
MSNDTNDARKSAHLSGIAATLRAFHRDKLGDRQSSEVAAEIYAAMRDRLDATDSPLSITEVGLAAEVVMGQFKAGAGARANETQLDRLRRQHPGFDNFSAEMRSRLSDADKARQAQGSRPVPNSIAAIKARPEESRTAMERWKLDEFERGGKLLSSPAPKIGTVKITPGDPVANLKALRSAETIAKLRRELQQARALEQDDRKPARLRSEAGAQAQRIGDQLKKPGAKEE